MAQGNSQRIRRIVRPRDALQAQKICRHELDLPLFRFAVASQRLFDLHGSIFKQTAAAFDAG